MIPKVKRIRLNKMRQKFAAGDTARDFKNIPVASEPVQQKIGGRNQFIDKFVAGQVKNPELAADAKQKYTTQQVQTNELLGGTTMAAPTNVGQQTITGSTITAPTTGVSQQVSTPTGITAGQMTAQTGTAQAGTAQTGTVGTQSQVGTVTGTLSGTATGATGCLLYTSPSPRDVEESRMPSSA